MAYIEVLWSHDGRKERNILLIDGIATILGVVASLITIISTASKTLKNKHLSK